MHIKDILIFFLSLLNFLLSLPLFKESLICIVLCSFGQYLGIFVFVKFFSEPAECMGNICAQGSSSPGTEVEEGLRNNTRLIRSEYNEPSRSSEEMRFQRDTHSLALSCVGGLANNLTTSGALAGAATGLSGGAIYIGNRRVTEKYDADVRELNEETKQDEA